MSVVTPVFISKTPERTIAEDGHKTYDCVDQVPTTAVKGMLRSAYEAITNSRYGVFNEAQHSRRLGLRLPAEAGVVPARVIRKNGALHLKLFCGESRIGRRGMPVDSRENSAPQYAAWIPTYVEPDQLPRGNNFAHGAEVAARIVLCRHGNWEFWRVVAMAPVSETPVTPPQLPRPGQRWSYEQKNGERIFATVKGYVVRSGKLIQNKHDERLFFNIDPQDCEPDVPIPPTMEEEYNLLLADYRTTHADGAFPPIGRGVQHGRHIEQDMQLSEGDFVYASFHNPENPGQRTLAKIFPVQISRDLHEEKPWNCLPDSLRSAKHMEELSPADRLFGWVNQNGKGAWRGKVRISTTTMEREDGREPLERFPSGRTLPLAILGAPKPAQARFYLGDSAGLAQEDGRKKRDAGYQGNKRLRGRKVYWRPRHVALANEDNRTNQYWQEPWNDRTSDSVNGYHQEYRQMRGPDKRTKQNRSITGWIRPGTVIRFSLRVENLAPEELGGLLQLANLEEWAGQGATLRIGMGKPLGMGCVRLELEDENSLSVGTAEQWIQYYCSFDAESPAFKLDKSDSDVLKRAFATALVTAYGANGTADWKELPFVKSFAAAAYGPQDEYAVHYPRRTPSRKSPSYSWFVENDSTRDGRTPGLSLPNAWQDSGLPYNP